MTIDEARKELNEYRISIAMLESLELEKEERPALKEVFEKDINRMKLQIEKIKQRIDAIPDEKSKSIIIFNNEAGLSLRKIANILNISVRHAERLHSKALKLYIGVNDK